MRPLLYRCPTTGYRVQGFVAGEVPAEGDTYEAVTCTACGRVHLVNLITGKVLGEDRAEGGREPGVVRSRA